jgi:hypothetical protein
MTAWLMMAAGAARQHAGNDGYDDEPSEQYVWDSTVANHGAVAVGDPIVLWDKRFSIGCSVVDRIRKSSSQKVRRRCPSCQKASFKARTTVLPRYLCFRCGHQFDVPDQSISAVTVYRSTHAAGWVAMPGSIDGATLRALAVSKRSQLSIRELEWGAFASVASTVGAEVGMVDRRRSALSGGHATRFTRVRIGQGPFRQRLLSQFGATCAFTGNMPEEALEAAHLYSYAQRGEHREFGGLLLRRDVHRLFDQGLLAVDPQTGLVDVDVSLHGYPTYVALHRQPLCVTTSDEHSSWLSEHWHDHRALDGDAALVRDRVSAP